MADVLALVVTAAQAAEYCLKLCGLFERLYHATETSRNYRQRIQELAPLLQKITQDPSFNTPEIVDCTRSLAATLEPFNSLDKKRRGRFLTSIAFATEGTNNVIIKASRSQGEQTSEMLDMMHDPSFFSEQGIQPNSHTEANNKQLSAESDAIPPATIDATGDAQPCGNAAGQLVAYQGNTMSGRGSMHNGATVGSDHKGETKIQAKTYHGNVMEPYKATEEQPEEEAPSAKDNKMHNGVDFQDGRAVEHGTNWVGNHMKTHGKMENGDFIA
ncbi:hypothetical protein PG994_009872 [Apiospora phragmitis]|uniref:NACHT-NTPase and P-loop NTPases N-terminal domain-containing protein n=1 Tax=Apiospora phragmitis TaxID=2905665 RepID=A0ABR1TNV7_9PEZI